MVKEKTDEEIEISLSGNRLKQAVVDALDDLVRLKIYHGISAPNRLKEMSNCAYWFLKHKPMFIDEEDIIYNTKFLGRGNGYFCVAHYMRCDLIWIWRLFQKPSFFRTVEEI